MKAADKIKLVNLRCEIAVGIHDLAHGRFQTYNDASLKQLVDDVCRSGRIRLNVLRQKVAAKVHKKK